MMPSKKWGALACAVAAASASCASFGPYVWADSLPEASQIQPAEYLLVPGDTIYVRVFNQESVSGRTRVRPDGRVTIPFLRDVPAAGRTTEELGRTVQTLLRDFINQAVVTISLEETAPAQLSVLGEVTRPGVYPLERGGQSVLRALAAAGGLTGFAHKDRIFVLRPGVAERIRFSLDGLATPGSGSGRFRLQNDDVVFVQ